MNLPRPERVLRLNLIVGCLVPAIVSACASAPSPISTDARREMLFLLMPERINIVKSFTRPARFESEDRPDGIELFVQAVNRFDDPGLMIVGTIRVELFEHVPASGDHRGRRLEHWQIDLSTSRQQESYWNGLTQMYEFRLGINPKTIPVADRYILAVTYQSPFDDRLSDEFVVDFRDVATRPASFQPTP